MTEPSKEAVEAAQQHRKRERRLASKCDCDRCIQPDMKQLALVVSIERERWEQEVRERLVSASAIEAVSQTKVATSSPGGFTEVGPTAALEALNAVSDSIFEKGEGGQ